jgi:hypothetical protein
VCRRIASLDVNLDRTLAVRGPEAAKRLLGLTRIAVAQGFSRPPTGSREKWCASPLDAVADRRRHI